MLTEALIKFSLESLQCEQNPPTLTTKYYCTHLVPVPNIRSFPLNVSDLGSTGIEWDSTFRVGNSTMNLTLTLLRKNTQKEHFP